MNKQNTINEIELSQLINDYDNLEDEIEQFEQYKSWKRPFIARNIGLQTEINKLDESIKETYESFMRVLEAQQTMVNNIHSKANYLKNKGINGRLVQKALQTRIDCLLKIHRDERNEKDEPNSNKTTISEPDCNKRNCSDDRLPSESEIDRIHRIASDVFNPDESDIQYALRRMDAHGMNKL